MAFPSLVVIAQRLSEADIARLLVLKRAGPKLEKIEAKRRKITDQLAEVEREIADLSGGGAVPKTKGRKRDKPGRKPGRPTKAAGKRGRKLGRPTKAVASPAKRGPGRPPKTSATPTKRGPGRPPKAKSTPKPGRKPAAKKRASAAQLAALAKARAARATNRKARG